MRCVRGRQRTTAWNRRCDCDRLLRRRRPRVRRVPVRALRRGAVNAGRGCRKVPAQVSDEDLHTGTPMTEIADRVAALDVTLFSEIPSQTDAWDRRALLALHQAAARGTSTFVYLEIGSYLGGSLQALV